MLEISFHATHCNFVIEIGCNEAVLLLSDLHGYRLQWVSLLSFKKTRHFIYRLGTFNSTDKKKLFSRERKHIYLVLTNTNYDCPVSVFVELHQMEPTQYYLIVQKTVLWCHIKEQLLRCVSRRGRGDFNIVVFVLFFIFKKMSNMHKMAQKRTESRDLPSVISANHEIVKLCSVWFEATVWRVRKATITKLYLFGCAERIRGQNRSR